MPRQDLMMGEQDVDEVVDEHQQRTFMKALLADLRALELMLETGMVESGIRRHRCRAGDVPGGF